MAVEVSINRSKSFARRRLRPSQLNVRSITQRLGMISKPSACGVRLTISSRSPAPAALPAATGP
jgi:hypothetical protein